MRSASGLLVIAMAWFLIDCGGGRPMHERPVRSAASGSPAPTTTPSSTRTPARAAAAPVVPPIVMTETAPTTPKSYAAAAPQKPKITGLSEDELKRCEADLPTLDSCKPSKTLAEGQSNVVDGIRVCVAHYVAALDGCLCKAGSKAHCQYAEDQKREIGKMAP